MFSSLLGVGDYINPRSILRSGDSSHVTMFHFHWGTLKVFNGNIEDVRIAGGTKRLVGEGTLLTYIRSGEWERVPLFESGKLEKQEGMLVLVVCIV